ncbi:MutS family DNA mismatch repair protein [Serpentinicella alkaliphila]|uniref:MutS-like protein n=1 Tax=Serpentinicella alkaliphila TaxID=1734049 RepID=A0A4R2TJE3_9FIRM|nr:MutS family DNA mismatch repair protein [Serpentinicella alkaliphila]QUH26392.1 DNA mismatch repair protein [Serpentinicella alkaliphila]TCP94932.1 MutS-like protein [Serpentinicella alkaliphila]
MSIYEKRVTKYEKLVSHLEKRLHSVGNWRLLTAVSGIIISAGADRFGLYYLFWSSILIFTSLFIYLVIEYNKLKKVLEYGKSMLKINGDSAKRLNGTWVEFEDVGEELKNENHDYSSDLDIFGRGSLFQWINTTNTYLGRAKLKDFLTKSCYSEKLLYDRQTAIIELAKKRWWRQRFQAEGFEIANEIREDERLIKWFETKNNFYARKDIVILIRLSPFVTISTFLLGYGFSVIPRFIPILALIIQIVMLLVGVKQRNIDLNTVYTYQRNIRVYKNMLKRFEKVNFKSLYINNLMEIIKSKDGLSAYKQLAELEKIVDSISNRGNLMFLPINIFLLWDYQCMVSLEKWKRNSGHLVNNWLTALGEMEALSSLAIISFDYPEWTMPVFTKESSVVRSKGIGHPLLTNKQVYNDLIIEKPKNILLITGSNMSGKSTLLRTIGINLVLAYAGAPVCAKEFQCSFMRIITCMRVSDNLEKSISSFYAELLRIKEILRATEESQQVFFLLDEIFKGTNSHDRHLGAKILIAKLYKQNAVGLVSTHDLELGELEQSTNGNIVNYHFQEHYKEGKIYFDYKLRKGISTTRNALYLMKMIGLED